MVRTILNWLTFENVRSLFDVSTDFERFRYVGGRVKADWRLRTDQQDAFEKQAREIRARYMRIKESNVRSYQMQLNSVNAKHTEIMDKMQLDYFAEMSALCLAHRDSTPLELTNSQGHHVDPRPAFGAVAAATA